MAKTIHTVLYDNELDGSKIVTMDNCVCQLYDIKRDYDSLIKDAKENLSKPALYVLLNRNAHKAYIGETDDFSQRIASHMLKKEFWDEALAFMANDNSLTTTEVRYLESLSYEIAKAAGIYDLSENTQVPKRPYVQSIQEYKIKDFFSYVKLLTKFVGCDVFEKTTSHQQNASFASSVRKTITVDLGIKSQDLEGREVKLSLNGMVFNKGKFGYAIVKEYLKFHPKATMAELKEIFHIGLLGSWGRWELLEDDLDYAKTLKESSGQFRHLVKDEFVLTSGDNIRFVVSNQWDKVNILNLLQIAKNQGWNYEIIKN
ncbi:MAG: GIY-YIG nuclease family protein [Prevotella sp.]|nr:GIY-YIG nuclease family protein [Prevotella sp.]